MNRKTESKGTDYHSEQTTQLKQTPKLDEAQVQSNIHYLIFKYHYYSLIIFKHIVYHVGGNDHT